MSLYLKISSCCFLVVLGIATSSVQSQPVTSRVSVSERGQALYHYDLWRLLEQVGWDRAFPAGVMATNGIATIEMAERGRRDSSHPGPPEYEARVRFDEAGRPVRIVSRTLLGVGYNLSIEYVERDGRVIRRRMWDHDAEELISDKEYVYSGDGLLQRARETLASISVPVVSRVDFLYGDQMKMTTIEITEYGRIQKYDLDDGLNVTRSSRAWLTWFGLCHTDFVVMEYRTYDTLGRLEYICDLPQGEFPWGDYYRYTYRDGMWPASRIRILRSWSNDVSVCGCRDVPSPCNERVRPDRVYTLDESGMPKEAIGTISRQEYRFTPRVRETK